MTNERKEIVEINGTVILIMMILVGNLFVGALIYRWHHVVVFDAVFAERKEYSDLLANVREVKNEIVLLEGTKTWNDTAYAKGHLIVPH
jgi:hypothetical protein